MHKPMWQKLLSWSSLTVALLLPLLGFGGYDLTTRTDDFDDFRETIQTVQSTSTASEREARIKQANFDNQIGFATGAELTEARKHYQETISESAIGAIYIPYADIKEPILAGTDGYNLFNGVATSSQDQRLGEGLWVGLAHNMMGDRQLLDAIDELEENDEIYATDFEDVYVYRVLEQKVVHETDDTYFKPPIGNEPAKMLLYRCEGEAGTVHRRAVYAEYMTSQPLASANSEVIQGLGLDKDLANEDDEQKENSKQQQTKQGTDNANKADKNQVDATVKNAMLSVYGFADAHTMVFIGIVTILSLVFYFV